METESAQESVNYVVEDRRGAIRGGRAADYNPANHRPTTRNPNQPDHLRLAGAHGLVAPEGCQRLLDLM
jgi:hypothetical protein